MQEEVIRIRGARTHNLKDVDVDIPIGKMTCFKGPSGSGKSSLAFATLFAESKRRYLNSMPDSLKFFSDKGLKPDVDEISPVLPAFALPQHNPVMTSRSVVMDAMGITDKLQKIFYFAGVDVCPDHYKPFKEMPIHEQVDEALPDGLDGDDIVYILIYASDFFNRYPYAISATRSYDAKKKEMRPLDEGDELIELVRFKYKSLAKLESKFNETFKPPYGLDLKIHIAGKKKLHKLHMNKDLRCPTCFEVGHDSKIEELSPYNGLGACRACNGYGAQLVADDSKIFPNRNLSIKDGAFSLTKYKRLAHFFRTYITDLKKVKFPIQTPINKLTKEQYQSLFDGVGNFKGINKIFKYLDTKKYKKDVRILMRNIQKEVTCNVCHGSRVTANAHYRSIKKLSYIDFLNLSVDEALTALEKLELNKSKNTYVKTLYKQVKNALNVSSELGLGNLPLLLKTKKLTTGEYQRLIMIKYLSYEGSHSLFVFDEPGLGLELDEQRKLIKALHKLRDQGNTVILVEHNQLFHYSSDEVIEVGPAAGHLGGTIVSQGRPKKSKITKAKTPKKNAEFKKFFSFESLKYENYPTQSFKFPVKALTQIIGPSSGPKAKFLLDVVQKEVHAAIEKIDFKRDYKIKKLSIPKLNDVLIISSNFGNISSRSTVGSYLGFSPVVRNYFAKLRVSKLMNLQAGHFSKNSQLGKCEECDGKGYKIIEMVFMEDLRIHCDDCDGKGLKKDYANITDGKLFVHEAFSLPIKEVFEHIPLTPKFKRILEYVELLNLDYLSLERTLNSLSGGERQRINLLSYLTQNIVDSLLILENISFGLSEREVSKIAKFLSKLTQAGNTVVVIDSHESIKESTDYTLKFN